MNQEYTCIICPLGCLITIHSEDHNIQSIEGARCAKGITYVTNEFHQPMRTVTSTIPVRAGNRLRVSVRTDGDVPKDQMFDVMQVIHQMELTAPITIGEVLCHNIAHTNTNLIATCEVLLL